jgi:hypothetical protein
MHTIHRFLPLGRLTLLLAAALILFGCQSTATYYQGYKADNDSISALTDPAAQGSWETFDINLTYQYDQTGDMLKISGAANFSLYYEMNITRIKNMDLYLFFLDENSSVLETARLNKFGYYQPEDQLSFAGNLAIPPGAKSFAFGYRGQAFEEGGGGGMGLDGDGGGGMHFFYDLPKRPES